MFSYTAEKAAVQQVADSGSDQKTKESEEKRLRDRLEDLRDEIAATEEMIETGQGQNGTSRERTERILSSYSKK